MNLQSLVVVVLRLLALDYLLRVALLLTPQMLQFLNLYSSSPRDVSRAVMLMPLLVLVGLLGAAVVLWTLAMPIARLVTRGVSSDLAFGALSLLDCYSIAFMGIGLFYISSHLPQVLNWTHFLFKAAASSGGDSWKEGVRWYEVSEAFVPFIVGIVLFVNGRRWAAKLAGWQTKHAPVATPLSEKHDDEG